MIATRNNPTSKASIMMASLAQTLRSPPPSSLSRPEALRSAVRSGHIPELSSSLEIRLSRGGDACLGWRKGVSSLHTASSIIGETY